MEKDMTKFDCAEEKGRKVIERLVSGHCLNYEFQPTNARIDLYVSGITENASIEIKNRQKYTAEDIESFGGHYIKYNKYCSLTASTLDGYKPFFCSIFKDKILFWDIMNTPITWENRYLDNTEVVNTGKSVQKVGFLHIKDAVAEYQTNKYKDEQSSGEDS